MSQNGDNHHPDHEPEGPGAISWFFQQIGWYLRKLVLWPIADSFRWIGSCIARIFDALRYRSPLAYIGTTLAVCVTAGAVAAAVYFYQQYEQTDAPPAPQPTAPAGIADTVIPPATSTSPPATTPNRNETEGDPNTLRGVVPEFSNTAARESGKVDQKRTAGRTVVKPAAPPKSGPLKVAHDFASTFAEYEVGEKKAAGRLKETASPRLARELRANPPKLPANGQVPKAAVMNVVKGKRSRNRLSVSVALLRSGTTSELRLALTHGKDGWRVSEVLG